MGGTKSIQFHDMDMGNWMFVIERSSWFPTEHLFGSDNVLVDSASSVFHDDTEWVLEDFLSNLYFLKDEIDMFASRLNTKHSRHCSWKSDLSSEFVDAFSRNWNNLFFKIEVTEH